MIANLLKCSVFSVVLTLMPLGTSWAQENHNEKIKLEVYGICSLDAKDFSGLIIELWESGKVISTIRDQAKYKFDLNYNSSYRIVINKPGYQRKILAILTSHVSVKRGNKGFDKFGVNPKLELVKHGKDIDPMKAYPDALIAFDKEIDDFNFSK